jgi:hypothetical protein
MGQHATVIAVLVRYRIEPTEVQRRCPARRFKARKHNRQASRLTRTIVVEPDGHHRASFVVEIEPAALLVRSAATADAAGWRTSAACGAFPHGGSR